MSKKSLRHKIAEMEEKREKIHKLITSVDFWMKKSQGVETTLEENSVIQTTEQITGIYQQLFPKRDPLRLKTEKGLIATIKKLKADELRLLNHVKENQEPTQTVDSTQEIKERHDRKKTELTTNIDNDNRNLNTPIANQQKEITAATKTIEAIKNINNLKSIPPSIKMEINRRIKMLLFHDPDLSATDLSIRLVPAISEITQGLISTQNLQKTQEEVAKTISKTDEWSQAGSDKETPPTLQESQKSLEQYTLKNSPQINSLDSRTENDLQEIILAIQSASLVAPADTPINTVIQVAAKSIENNQTSDKNTSHKGGSAQLLGQMKDNPESKSILQHIFHSATRQTIGELNQSNQITTSPQKLRFNDTVKQASQIFSQYREFHRQNPDIPLNESFSSLIQGINRTRKTPIRVGGFRGFFQRVSSQFKSKSAFYTNTPIISRPPSNIPFRINQAFPQLKSFAKISNPIRKYATSPLLRKGLNALGGAGKKFLRGIKNTLGKIAKSGGKKAAKWMTGALSALTGATLWKPIMLTVTVAVLFIPIYILFADTVLFQPRRAAFTIATGDKTGGGVVGFDQSKSKYATIAKTANPTSLENPIGKITYSYTITPLLGPISISNFSDEVTILQESGQSTLSLDSPPEPPPLEITEKFSVSDFHLTLSSNMNDALISNKITISFTSPDGTEETISTLASTTIGNPPSGCFVFAEPPAPNSSVGAVSWSSAPGEQAKEEIAAATIMTAFGGQSNILCSAPINLYLARTGLAVDYGGWYLGGGSIALDFKKGSVGSQGNALYTLAHESGHIYDTRSGMSAVFKQSGLVSWNGSTCIGNIYPYEEYFTEENGKCYSENFAEGFALYISGRPLPSGWRDWYAVNVFGN